MDRPVQDADLLLAHSAWVRRLARSLVADSHSADDLVQRTWVAALERPPGEHVPLRSWFAAVLRNLARQDRRASGRRAAREKAAARSDILPAADESLEGIARQKMLMQAVLELNEPYRTVIVRRYYDGLPPREIARELRIPVKTVKTRLARALEKLRERLDREHGFDRSAWVALFAPWFHASGAGAGVTGGLLVNAKVKVGLVAALVAGTIAAVVQWPLSDTSSSQASTAAAAPAQLEASDPVVADVLVGSTDDPIERAPVSAATPTEKTTVAPVAPEPRIRGRVIDLTGTPVASIDVSGDRSRVFTVGDAGSTDRSFKLPLARTDSNGEFDFVNNSLSSKNSSQLFAENEAWTTALSPSLELFSDRDRSVTIVVAQKVTLAGRVIDEARQPIEGATLRSTIDDKLRSGLGEILDMSIAVSRELETDASGRFEIRDVPAAPGLITVAAATYELQSLPTPVETTLDLEIVLRKPVKPHVIVRGIVLEPEGRPADGALVSHGAEIEETGPDGRFQFDQALAVGGSQLVANEAGGYVPKADFRQLYAVKAGFGPAHEELPGLGVLRASGKVTEVTLVLGPRPLAIKGRVVDARGSAVAGATVWLRKGTPFGQFIERHGDAMYTYESTVEDALRRKLHSTDVTTDSDGRFELGGVLDREYDLLAVDSKTVRFGRREGVRGGEASVEILIPDDPPTQRVAGCLVSHSGQRVRVAGVNVRLGRRSEPNAPTQWPLSRTTDAEGRFDFGDVAADGVHFQLTGEQIAFVFDYEPPADSKLDDLELPVSRQCHVQIELGDQGDLADSFAVVDDKGAELKILCWRGLMAMEAERFPIDESRSDVVVVLETGRQVVLYKAGVEVMRMPLSPKPGELTTIRP